LNEKQREKAMLNSPNAICWCAVATSLLVLTAGCAPPQPPEETTPTGVAVKSLSAGAENAGFLSDYSKLTPDPDLGGEVLSYVNPDELKDLHRYMAIIVDPVEVYLASDADPSQLPENGATAAVEYFQYAIRSAVADAFPLVSEPGPLVLRLRSALVGVDIGGEVAAGDLPEEGGAALARAVNVTDVIAEFELVDSLSGEVIAAALDKAHLGEAAEIGATHFSRMERFDAAQEAFDAWAEGLREFLDSKHELSGEDAQRADQAYSPYGQ
jgi:hypothetical protein